MKNLLRVVLTIAIIFSFSNAKAQISAGAGAVYGTGINNIGFSLNGKYVINEVWSAAPSFTFFLKKDFVSWSALDLDANYQLKEFEGIGVLYAIGGLNMTFFKIKYDLGLGGYGDFDNTITGSNAGVNLGLGLNVPAGEKLVIAPEIRYTLGGANYLRIGAKAMYQF